MTTYYQRDAVPLGGHIYLEVQFSDSAGNPKDADIIPTVSITDAATAEVRADSSSGVLRIAKGRYRLDYTVPDGFVAGMWNDIWSATLDGYSISNTFDFTVNPAGSIEAVGSSVPETTYSLSDEDLSFYFSNDEIRGILLLRKTLKTRLRTVAYKPDGTPCPAMDDDTLNQLLCAALSEFNATPTLTSFSFADNIIQTLAHDIITQGAMLGAWAGQAVIEAGFEFTVNDSGVTVQPPPVSSTISTMYNAQLSDYRSKLKEIKRNLRPGPMGLGAGSILVVNPVVRRLRHLRERRIL